MFMSQIFFSKTISLIQKIDDFKIYCDNFIHFSETIRTTCYHDFESIYIIILNLFVVYWFKIWLFGHCFVTKVFFFVLLFFHHFEVLRSCVFHHFRFFCIKLFFRFWKSFYQYFYVNLGIFISAYFHQFGPLCTSTFSSL